MPHGYSFNIRKYLLAVIIDIILLYSLILILSFVSVIISFSYKDMTDIELGILILISILIVWVFYFFILFRKTGQTIAMKLFKLKVYSSSKSKIPFTAALCWGFFLSNPITALLSSRIVTGPPFYTQIEQASNTKIFDELLNEEEKDKT